MDGLITHEELKSEFPTLIVAFAGWPDAAEAATRAIRYMVRRLPAKKFAEIESEEFYDFTVVRPETRINRGGERVIDWPVNKFYYFLAEDPSRSLILFSGTEPNLRWRSYSSIITDVAERCGVKLVVSLGALLDGVPHTREPPVTGRASSRELTQKAEWLGIRDSKYQGPTGIHTSFMEACTKRGMSYASIWGHSPHYVNVSPNPKVTQALLTRLRGLVDFDVEFDELRRAADAFEVQVADNMAGDTELKAYLARLEQLYDDNQVPSGDIPSPETMVRELEDFLKGQRSDDGDGP